MAGWESGGRALCVSHTGSCTNEWHVEPTDSMTPALNFGMSNQRFEAITSAIVLSISPPPNPDDQFWEIRPFMQAWNLQLKSVFPPSWLVGLDESLMMWEKLNCPGWVIVGHKFTDKGNMACSYTKINFQVEIVEGKDRPLSIGYVQYEEYRK